MAKSKINEIKISEQYRLIAEAKTLFYQKWSGICIPYAYFSNRSESIVVIFCGLPCGWMWTPGRDVMRIGNKY